MKLRVIAQEEVPSTVVDMDELVQAIAEELFPGSLDSTFPEKVEKKILDWFMGQVYPQLKDHEEQPPNPNGYVGSDALGSYRVSERVAGALNDLVESFLYTLAGAEYDYTDFRGDDLLKGAQLDQNQMQFAKQRFDELQQTLGRPPTVDEMATELNLPVDQAEQLLAPIYQEQGQVLQTGQMPSV